MSTSDDPDKLLNEWLGELENLIGGLEVPSPSHQPVRLRPKTNQQSERINSYRFSMANLEDTQEAELDAILGELSILEQKGDLRGRCHSRTGSNTMVTATTIQTNIVVNTPPGNTTTPDIAPDLREPRTESPDNDSAFSDTVSLLSSESSASSGVSSGIGKTLPSSQTTIGQDAKSAKIQLALQKMEHASVKRLFVKAFSADGASKSLLVDERMTCGYVTRLLADKNHVPMEANWALVEHLPELQMERLFEDHELLVDSLLMWDSNSKNRVLFLKRNDKTHLFTNPENYLPGTQMAPGSEHDEHTRSMLLEEFFTTGAQLNLEGPLYLKSDSKKGWKRFHFTLRNSGLYYYPKEQKTRSVKDLICLALFAGHNVYKGIGWKKKHKSPTDFTFAMKCPTSNSNNIKTLKMLCAEDAETMEKWVTAIRVVKYGKRLLDNYRILIEDLARDDLDKMTSTRSGSINSIASSIPSQYSSVSSNGTLTNGNSNNNVIYSAGSNGRLSRASSSSSSGCLSDDNNGFDSEFTTGTIKRKPSMKPNLPLTSKTRQLMEVGETTRVNPDSNPTSPERGGTLTRRHSRRRSEESNGSNGTLIRRQGGNRGSIESMNSTSSTPTPTPSAPGTPLGHQAIFNNVIVTSPAAANVASPLETIPSCMTDSMLSLPPPPEDLGVMQMSLSTLSLDSLPPPPDPSELTVVDSSNFNGSQISLVSLPPPPPEVTSVINMNGKSPASPLKENANVPPIPVQQQQQPIIPNNPSYCSKTLPAPTSTEIIKEQPIYAKTMKPALKAPPYKAPPAYNGQAPSTPPPLQKSVTFAESPVMLRKKVCFEDQVQQIPISPRRASRDSMAPVPPPRAEATRLSSNATIYFSPKRLSDSAQNPPQDFWRDLQRVMKKKWQVAQKCKMEPTTTPHEVLGFRDLNGGGEYSSHFYRETANVSNWVQEHYGCDTLYENLGNNVNMMEPIYPISQPIPQSPNAALMKKRPPPPPPRSESTHLTTTAPLK